MNDTMNEFLNQKRRAENDGIRTVQALLRTEEENRKRIYVLTHQLNDDLGVRQVDLAKHFGVSQSAIRKWVAQGRKLSTETPATNDFVPQLFNAAQTTNATTSSHARHD